MLKNYIKIALRNIVQQKLYSGLNILGLAVGMAAALMIFLFVQHELSYDRFFEDSDRIYRVIERQPNNVFMGNDRFVVTPASLAGSLVEEFPEVADATTLARAPLLLTAGEQSFYEFGLWADGGFFDVLDFPLVSGDIAQYGEPGSMVLTASIAEKIFGDTEALGQVIEVSYWGTPLTFSVGAVIEDPPANSHLAFDFLLPMQARPEYTQHLEQRTQNSYLTYFKLAAGSSIGTVNAKMPAFVQDYLGEAEAENYIYLTQPIKDVHLRGNVNFELGVPGDIRYVYVFGSIGFLILILACVNYINLAMARSMKRAREVGLRQVIGARKIQIAGQFVAESVLMSIFAVVLGVGMVHLALPNFSGLVDRPLVLDWAHPLLIPGLASLALVVGLIAGSYPALMMARFRPARVLKGVSIKGRNRSALQRTLIVMQYTISIALIAGSFVIYQQLQYIKEKEVGYSRDNIVTMRVNGSEARAHIDTILEEMRRVPQVVGATALSSLPTNIQASMGLDKWEGSQEGDEIQFYRANVGHDFFALFDVELAAGRTFSPEIASDTVSSVIVNETAARSLGWSLDEAAGKRIDDTFEVVGVIKDFHTHSLHLPIAPLMLTMNNDWYSYIAIRIAPQQTQETVAQLTQILASRTPYPVTHEFLDTVYDDMYEADMQLGSTIGYFAFLAILIASLGLFGLAAYAVEQRTKEIGVRKVLGATMPRLLSMLSSEFLQMVAIATVLALPLAFLIASRWLEDFAFKVELGAGVFLLTTLLVMFVTIATVSYQAFRAASLNPVEALRYE